MAAQAKGVSDKLSVRGITSKLMIFTGSIHELQEWE
jgi:hypothetical protein